MPNLQKVNSPLPSWLNLGSVIQHTSAYGNSFARVTGINFSKEKPVSITCFARDCDLYHTPYTRDLTLEDAITSCTPTQPMKQRKQPMSNSLSNAYAAFGSPCGLDADSKKQEEWAGTLLLNSEFHTSNKWVRDAVPATGLVVEASTSKGILFCCYRPAPFNTWLEYDTKCEVTVYAWRLREYPLTTNKSVIPEWDTLPTMTLLSTRT